VTLEAIVIAALLLADLTVPSKPLEALRLHRISEVFTDNKHNKGGWHIHDATHANQIAYGVPTSARGIMSKLLVGWRLSTTGGFFADHVTIPPHFLRTF